MIVNLHLLRGIAALMVLAHHLRDLVARPGSVWHDVQVGAAGVDLFFVISGVVIGLTLARPGLTARGFAAARVLRVVPLYWAMTLGIAALAFLGFAPLGWPVGVMTPAHVAAALAFWPMPRPDGLPLPVLGVGWSLVFEMLFYTLAAGAVLVGRRPLPVVCALTLGLVLAGLVFPAGTLPLTVLTHPLMLEFVAGLALAALWRRGRVLPLWLVPGAMLLSAGLLVWAALWPGFHVLDPARVPWFGTAAVLITAAALSLDAAGRVRAWPRGCDLGRASYALYLTHPLVLQGTGTLWARAGGEPGIAPALCAGGLAVLVALWVDRRVDTPLRLWLSRVAETGGTRPHRSAPPRCGRATTNPRGRTGVRG